MFTDIFGNGPRVRLLDFLADHVDFDYTISQMAEFAHIARPTVYKLVAELESQCMMSYTREVGGSKFYRLSLENPWIVSMLQVDFEGVNKELASGIYDEKMPGSREAPVKSISRPRPGGRVSLPGRTVPVHAHSRRSAKRKKSKSPG